MRLIITKPHINRHRGEWIAVAPRDLAGSMYSQCLWEMAYNFVRQLNNP